MSDVILEQIKDFGLNEIDIKKIKIEDIINEEVKAAFIEGGEKYIVDNWGEIGPLDKMANRIIGDISKNIIDIYIKYENTEGVTGLNVIINLQ